MKDNFGDKINTNGLDKNPENINKNGRPRKIYTILKAQGYSKDDFCTAIGELFWYNLGQLQDVHKDEIKPVIIRIISNQLFLALKNGDYGKIKELAEQYLGKPLQKAEVEYSGEIKTTEIDYAKLSDETLEQIKKDIET